LTGNAFHTNCLRLVLTPTVCILLLMVSVAFTSCKFFQKPKPQKTNPIARVGNHFLYADDIQYLFSDKEKIADSTAVVKTYVDDWIRKKLLLETAVKYLPADKQNLEQQIQDYRESLLIYQYEDELIKQKLDTVVSDAAVDSFYEINKQNFQLEDDLVQMNYVKLPIDAPKVDSVKYLLTYPSEKNRQRLMNYCYQYAVDFYMKDSLWIDMEMLLKKIPAEREYITSLAKSNSTGEVADSNYLYLLKVNDYKQKGEVAPLNYIKNELRFMLVNKRKQELISTAYDKIYQDAIKDGNFEVFTK
jgi:hypothetical protein